MAGPAPAITTRIHVSPGQATGPTPIYPGLVVDASVPDAVWIAGDYHHIGSQGGRWAPSIQEWVFGTMLPSPAIDAGDPNSVWTRELWPHGRLGNIGAFSGTSEASMSLSNVGNCCRPEL